MRLRHHQRDLSLPAGPPHIQLSGQITARQNLGWLGECFHQGRHGHQLVMLRQVGLLTDLHHLQLGRMLASHLSQVILELPD